MDVGQLVTYMELPDEVATKPNALSKNREIMIHTRGFENTVNFLVCQTAVDGVQPDETEEGYVKNPTEDRSFHTSYREQHNKVVRNYEDIGYRVVTYQDYKDWDRKLEEIPGLDSFGLSFEQKQLEFLKYLRDQEKV